MSPEYKEKRAGVNLGATPVFDGQGLCKNGCNLLIQIQLTLTVSF